MRLIDADVLRNQWLYEGKNEHIYDTNDFLDSIDEQPTAFDKEKVIDDVFELLKSKRDARYMKIPFDDLEIRKYKNELKRGGVDARTDD